MFRTLSASILLFCLVFTSACSYFRLPVLQGNIVDYEKAEQLELGMTPRQVEFLLGTPLVRDSFGTARWDYVVYYRSPQAKEIQKNLSVFFENDVVSRIEGRDELLADWRKQKAAVKQVKEILETPHPGQLPANAGPVNPQNPDEPHPVIPPANEEVRGEITEDEPTPEKDEDAAPPPAYIQEQQTETEAPQPVVVEPAQTPQPSESSEPDYPPDMTTIYKK